MHKETKQLIYKLQSEMNRERDEHSSQTRMLNDELQKKIDLVEDEIRQVREENLTL